MITESAIEILARALARALPAVPEGRRRSEARAILDRIERPQAGDGPPDLPPWCMEG